MSVSKNTFNSLIIFEVDEFFFCVFGNLEDDSGMSKMIFCERLHFKKYTLLFCPQNYKKLDFM